MAVLAADELLELVAFDGLDGGGSRFLDPSSSLIESGDGGHRDGHPRRPVARLVDGFVDGLVGDVGGQQRLLVDRELVAGVRLQEGLAVARPTTRWRGTGAARRRRCRARTRSARRPGARSRTSAACRRRRASGSRAPAARSAAWPARPRSRRSSSPGRCAASARGAGRRGSAGRVRRASGARGRTSCAAGRRAPRARARSPARRRAGGACRPPARSPRRAARVAVGKCSRRVSWVSASAMPSRADSPAKSPPTSSACRSASVKRLRTLTRARSQPSLAVRRNCWSMARCTWSSSPATPSGAVASSQP